MSIDNPGVSASPSPVAPSPAAPAGGDQNGSPAPAAPALPGVTDSFTDIPEDFRNDPDFQGLQLKDVFSKYKELNQLQTARDTNGLIPMIGDNSAPEQIQAFYERLGKPKSPAEYDLQAPEDLPEGLDYSDERAAEFAKFAHENHLTKNQTQALFGWYHNMLKSSFSEYAQSQEDALVSNLTQLEQVWGGPQGSDKFAQNHQNAMRAFNAVADPDIAAAFKADPMLASNPLVLTVLSRLGAKMAPDSVPSVTASVPTGKFTDSLSSVEKAIKDFHSSGKFKSMVNGGGNVKELRSEWQSLQDKRRQLQFGAE
jgi:hypothetical protein